VIEWLPKANAEVVSVAFPRLRLPVPSRVAPSLKATVPVGVPEVAGFTVAVKVTAWPDFDGFTEDTTEVVEAAWFTPCDRTGEVLRAKLASPLYTATMECGPTVSFVVVNAALPALSVPVPSVAAPFLNVTVPVGVPEPAGVTVAVKVTLWPKVDGFTLEARAVVVVVFTFSVNVCCALPALLMAVNVTGNVPEAAGVPLSVPVPLPLSVNLTPFGKVPLSAMLGVGAPVVVTVNEP
jgi:hypothetical protein